MRPLMIAFSVLVPLWSSAPFARAQNFDEQADQRVRRVVKILRTTNKAQVNQFVPVAFDLKHVNPNAVLRFIARPIEAEEGNYWTFVHPDGNKGRLLVNAPIWQVESLKEIVALIDRPNLTNSSGDKREYYPLKHRDPGDGGFLAAVLANLTRTGQVLPDRATGHLFVEDAPSGISAALRKIQEEIDLPTDQVVLRIKVYEIELDNDGSLGLDFHAWKNGPGRNLAAGQVFAEGGHISRVGGSDGGEPLFTPSGADVFGLPGRRFANNGQNIAYHFDFSSEFFDFLTVKGRARLVTAPRLTVLNTETAIISTGEQILYYKVQAGPAPIGGVRPPDLPLDPNGVTDVENEERVAGTFPDNRTVSGTLTPRQLVGVADAGIALEVTPVISENFVNVELFLEAVSQLGFDGAGAPVLGSRRVDTVLRAAPGREYLLGGLLRTRANQITRKVPILGSIPVLGWLFGSETTDVQKSIVAVALTVESVTDYRGLNRDDEAAISTAESPGFEAMELPQTLHGFDQ